MQYIKTAATNCGRVQRSPLRSRAIYGRPIYRLSHQPAAPQIAFDIRPRCVDLRRQKDAPENPKGESVPHFQAVQPGEWQRTGGCMNESLGIQAVGIVNVIRNEQAAIRVKIHAASIALIFARHENQIGQEFIAKDPAPPGRCVRPPDPARPMDNRLGDFQFMNAGEKPPALPRRQCLNPFQNVLCAHHEYHTTRRAFRASLSCVCSSVACNCRFPLWRKMTLVFQLACRSGKKALAANYGPQARRADMFVIGKIDSQAPSRSGIIRISIALQK